MILNEEGGGGGHFIKLNNGLFEGSSKRNNDIKE